ncbi:DUF6630 family protein [Serinibacter arcticus]|uniref:DUF6630 family protein n=1 Tax=Serinibacter arcticus TaxID=1655435 RepID=UPI0013047C64|nr:hypothetical protein [Serinibacter arcticus]
MTWNRLCTLLDDDPQVGEAVALALAAATDDTDTDAAWAALIDALDEAGALACLDRADTGDLLVDAVAPLPRVARAAREGDVDLGAVVDVDDLTEAIALANATLAVVGLELIALDEEDGDDDCLPLVAVGTDDVAEITALVEALGHRLLPVG